MDPHEVHHWPLYGLRITTPRLELRVPGIALLDELAAVAADEVHDPAEMPFSFPWTDVAPEERGRATFQHVLGTIAEWSPRKWTLSLAVLCEGRVVGRQDMTTGDYAVTREGETGSWLGLAHQGKGIGTKMRAAVLHLAFGELGARAMTTGAMTDNPRSLAVSRKCGYRPDGETVVAVRGAARTVLRMRLDRAGWKAHRTVPVEVHGVGACRGLFGISRG
ncbi:GNAT family N-acetyltransferase [Streptomyces sp. F63]|uniref:GNAT family N-acetyltransferase n=1 Tax=Streptomyces sp. F63 TaxID=2824887 RepID=UPI001B38DCAD|nr:GNAT family protein [Streptomyces sp. F63]MBQ0986133.1 GNAT family N-acetyltransferase [Streptomyces sp. F63]